MVVLATDPVIPPGLMVQLPDGKPPNVTLPVAVEQVGCVVELIVGADGVAGCALMTTLANATEVHPAAFVTV